MLSQAAAETDPCHARKCTSNEHCCDGTVCVDTSSGVTGSCLPVFGKKAGEACYMDADCETGYVCQDSVCMVPAPGIGQFGESWQLVPIKTRNLAMMNDPQLTSIASELTDCFV